MRGSANPFARWRDRRKDSESPDARVFNDREVDTQEEVRALQERQMARLEALIAEVRAEEVAQKREKPT